jgi:hypothetical protein
MLYDIMLLADPGPERAAVLRVMQEAPDIRPDSELSTRFWLATAHGEAQVNIGTKDPVESIHVEVETGSLLLMEAATRRALELSEGLEMRVEDVQWGHEVTLESLPRLREFWAGSGTEPARVPLEKRRPWWRPW